MEVMESTVDITSHSEDSKYFDEVIGCIEDIIISEKFQSLHDDFLAKHCEIFEPTEENKLEYMDVFNSYTALFERYLQTELQLRMKEFNMERFTHELEKYDDCSGDNFERGEIFELLNSFTNFQAFKEKMLDFRGQKDIDIGDILLTRKLVCLEEEEEKEKITPELEMEADGDSMNGNGESRAEPMQLERD